MYKSCITSLLIFISIIGCKANKEKVHFLSTEVQVMEQRDIIENALTLVLERDLEELEIFGFAKIEEIKNNFILVETKLLGIKYLNKKSLELKKAFTITSGRGPKELEFIMASDVSEEIVAVADHHLMKVILFDHEGNMIREFLTDKKIPHRLALTENGSMNIMYEVFFDDIENGFLENLNLFGELNYNFEKEGFKRLHPFATEGHLKSIKDTLYYVGEYEPFIKKYVNGKLIYTMATIDNHDTALNYVTIISDESRSTSLTPEAVFSTRDFDIKNGLLFIIPSANGVEGFSYIDIYDTGTGKYIKSYKTINPASQVEVYEEERFILTIETDGETQRPVFRKYSY